MAAPIILFLIIVVAMYPVIHYRPEVGFFGFLIVIRSCIEIVLVLRNKTDNNVKHFIIRAFYIDLMVSAIIQISWARKTEKPKPTISQSAAKKLANLASKLQKLSNKLNSQ